MLLGLVLPLQAQTFVESSALPVSQPSSSGFKVQGSPSEDQPLIASQDSLSLESTAPKASTAESEIEAGVLDQPSPYRAAAVGKTGPVTEIPTEHLKQDLARVSATYREPGTPESNCSNIALSIEQRLKFDSSLVLQIVEKEVAANPGCSCEIVKAAIQSSSADAELVVSIVEVAITAAPESMRMSSQCAIASMPEALGGVQALLARLDVNSGDSGYSSKGAKSAKSAKGPKHAVAAMVDTVDEVAALPNPLDFPGIGPVGPTPGGQGGQPLVPVFPPVILPPSVTEVSL